jgi:hypothetical protein
MESSAPLSINAVLHTPPNRTLPLVITALGLLIAAALCGLLWSLFPRQQQWVLLVAVPPALGLVPLGLWAAARRMMRGQASACPGRLHASPAGFVWEPVEGPSLTWERSSVESVHVVHVSAPGASSRRTRETSSRRSRTVLLLTLSSEKWSRVLEAPSVPYRMEQTLQELGPDKVILRLPVLPRPGRWTTGMIALPAVWAAITLALAMLVGTLPYLHVILHILVGFVDRLFAGMFLLAAALVLHSAGRAFVQMSIDERGVRAGWMGPLKVDEVTVTPLPRGGFALAYSPRTGAGAPDRDASSMETGPAAPSPGESAYELEMVLYAMEELCAEIVQAILTTSRLQSKEPAQGSPPSGHRSADP